MSDNAQPRIKQMMRICAAGHLPVWVSLAAKVQNKCELRKLFKEKAKIKPHSYKSRAI